MSGPAPADSYQTKITDADQTVSLIDAVFTKLVNPLFQQVSLFRQSREGVKSLKDGLGEWVDEAKGAKGTWLQPVLRKDAFAKHFLSEDGHLQPSGESTALFAWAQLLYSLNIRPGRGILSWKPIPKDQNPAKTGVVSLAVDGEILCHIVNLYQLYKSRARDCGSVTYNFPFGDLTLQDSVTHIFMFRCGSLADLSSPKRPFQYEMQDQHGLREGYLKFDKNTIITRYLTAIDHTASESQAVLEDANQALTKRGQSLLRAMALLNEGNWDKPYLITPTWIEEASRVKRRFTTNGGTDEFLIEHVLECISERPEVVKRLKAPLARKDLWEDELKSSILDLCMYEKDAFKFIWDMGIMFRSKKNPTFEAILQQELPWVLEKLAEMPAGSWGKTVSEAVSAGEMLEMLRLPHEIVNMPIIVLQDPSKWNFAAEIAG